MVNPDSLKKVVGQNNIDNPNVIKEEREKEREREKVKQKALFDRCNPAHQRSGRMCMNRIRMGMMILLTEIDNVLIEHKHANLIKNLKNSRSFNTSDSLRWKMQGDSTVKYLTAYRTW